MRRKVLTEKQQKFVELVSAGKPITQSYIAAGYSPINASENVDKTMKNPRVMEEIKKIQGLRREQYVYITKELVIEELRKIQDGTSSDNTKLKALSMICKIMGFEDTVVKVQTNEPLFIINRKEEGNKNAN